MNSSASSSNVPPKLEFLPISNPAEVCYEGTPNCLPVDPGHQKVQDQLNDAETSGQCAGPDGFCDDEIPGSDVEPSEGAVKPAAKPVISVLRSTSLQHG